MWVDAAIREYGRRHIDGWGAGAAFDLLPFRVQKGKRWWREIKGSKKSWRIVRAGENIPDSKLRKYKAAAKKLREAYNSVLEFCLAAKKSPLQFIEWNGVLRPVPKERIEGLFLKQRVEILCTSHCQDLDNPKQVVGLLVSRPEFERFLNQPAMLAQDRLLSHNHLINVGLKPLVDYMVEKYGEDFRWIQEPYLQRILDSWNDKYDSAQDADGKKVFALDAADRFLNSSKKSHYSAFRLVGRPRKDVTRLRDEEFAQLSSLFITEVEKKYKIHDDIIAATKIREDD